MLERSLMCCNPVVGHGVRRKVKASVVKKFGSEAKMVGIGAERRKTFSSRPEKGINGLSFVRWRRKSRSEKTASRSRSSETPHKGPIQAACQLIVCSKYKEMNGNIEEC